MTISKAKRKRKKTAKKASNAKTISEKKAKKFLQDKKYVLGKTLFLNAKGIPDIIALDKTGLKFYEVKPHMMRRGYKKTGRWKVVGDKDRLLRRSQRPVFKNLVNRGEDVNMVYYYRKRYGTKANPKYRFKYKLVKLGKTSFKGKGPDPQKLQLIDKKLDHWMNIRTV